LGIDPGRVRLEWISSAEGQRFAQVITDFTNEIKELGPNPIDLSRSEAVGATR